MESAVAYIESRDVTVEYELSDRHGGETAPVMR